MSKWEWKKLGEVCEFKDSQRKPITANKRVVGPYPYYGATGILDYVEGFLFDEDLILLGEDGAKWGSGDKSAFVISGKTWVNNHAHVLKPDSSVDYQWLIYYLNFSDLMKYVKGATVPKLNQENAKKILVPIPPLSEQKRIVKFLDEEISKIETLKTNAETNLKNAKELFETTLEKELNPPSRHSERSEESSADLPSGWEWEILKNLGKTQTGSTPSTSKPQYWDGDIPFLKPSNISYSGELDLNQIQYLSPSGAEKSRIIPRNSVLMVCIGASIGKVGLVEELVTCNQQINAITPKKDVDVQYLYYALRTETFQNKMKREAGQATLPIINKSKWENLQIPLPPLSVQKEIVARLDKLSENVKRLEANYKQIIANCDELKKSILKKTFEGES